MAFPFRPKNKFRAVRTNGMGSKLEAAVYQILLLRQKAGEISDIKQQVSVDLSCGIRWKVDFSFFDKCRDLEVWAEAKGLETERYRMCVKLWRGGHGPGLLEIWKGSYQRPILKEIVIPKK